MMVSVLQIVVLSWVLIRVASTSVKIITTEALSIHLNGVLKRTIGPGDYSIPMPLSEHDVLALTMTPMEGREFELKVTTDDTLPAKLAWRFAEGNVSSGWEHRFWKSACTWDVPLSDDEYLNFQASGSGDAIYFRGVVGDPCGEYHPQVLEAQTTADTATFSVAIHDQAWVFLNGRHLGDIATWTTVWKKTVSVTTGDVLAIKVMAGTEKGGVLALAKSALGSFATKGNGWRVARVKTADVGATLAIGYNDCGWGTGTVKTALPRAATAPSGAQYVWPDGTAAGEIVVARYVVGYENRCGSTKVTTTAPRPDLCTCTKLPANDWSDCYYYTKSGSSACAVRKCDDKYVCTSEETDMVCVRKVSKTKIVPVQGRVGICESVADNTVQYMPYQQW